MSTYPNVILRNLSKSDLALFEAALSSHAFTHGQVLGEIGTPIERVFFPSSGLISLRQDAAIFRHISCPGGSAGILPGVATILILTE